MKSIVEIIQQRVIYYGGLDKLKEACDVDPIELFTSFVEEFASSKNTKERQIPNPIDATVEDFDDVLEEHNNGDETRYTAQQDGKELAYNYYEATDTDNNDEDKNKSEGSQDSKDNKGEKEESDSDKTI